MSLKSSLKGLDQNAHFLPDYEKRSRSKRRRRRKTRKGMSNKGTTERLVTKHEQSKLLTRKMYKDRPMIMLTCSAGLTYIIIYRITYRLIGLSLGPCAKGGLPGPRMNMIRFCLTENARERFITIYIS